MRLMTIAVWSFINIIFFGMCGYMYLVWSKYWISMPKEDLQQSIESQLMSFDGVTRSSDKHQQSLLLAKVRRSAVGHYRKNKVANKANNTGIADNKVIKKSHGSPRFPNIHSPVLEFDSGRYSCNDSTSIQCVGITSSFRELVEKEFHRVLMIWEAASAGEVLCALGRVRVRTVTRQDQPFARLGFSVPPAPLQPERAFNTCAVVSSSGALLGSGLGSFIGFSTSDLHLTNTTLQAIYCTSDKKKMPVDLNAVKNQFKQTWLTTILSLILFAGVTYFLLWAESHTIQSNLMLEELVSSAVSIDVHTGDEAARYEGRVVHIVGPLRILEPISEPDYNIQVQAVKLRKRVQMYQWIEETTEQENFLSEPAEESQKTYWYHKDWRDYVVDSNLFYIRPGHHNPTSMPLFSETHIAENVKIGWLFLGVDVKRKVNDYYEIWSDSRPERSDIKLHSGFYYHGESALQHEVGDLRIHFSYAGREDDIDGVLQSYSPGNFPGADPISLLRKGSFSLQQLHDLESRAANVNTWKYRILGFVQVFASAMTLHPDWITFSTVPVDIEQLATVYKDLGQPGPFVFIHSFGHVDSMGLYFMNGVSRVGEGGDCGLQAADVNDPVRAAQAPAAKVPSPLHRHPSLFLVFLYVAVTLSANTNLL
ncbi:hypothetical protein MSG28_000342 [Choristoneura fumiferana]|uniref:Uncharacterized protein n=1 Tax=Choristoneura fumiferana TaxID=7141 RepID=A0ACC0K0G5_CHOFU|nr:hypothetical protein MSG28_000342 [Choristoneura fumiferana]